MTAQPATIARTASPIARLTLLSAAVFALAFFALPRSAAQSSDGPMAPRPGVVIQQPPPQAPPLKVQVNLINTPVAVYSNKGEMVHTLDAKDFQVTDNGIPQKITHFDLGSDPISMVILLENSSRIAPLLPALRKAGILFTQTVLGPRGEAAVVSFNDGIDKLQDFTNAHGAIESTIAQIPEGTRGTKLFDAMAIGVEMLSGRPLKPTEVPTTRRVLMIVAEAVDVGSTSNLADVLKQAELANITIYSVGLSTIRSMAQAEAQNGNGMRTNPPGTIGRPVPPGAIDTPDTRDAMNGIGPSGIDLTGLAKIVLQQTENELRAHPLQAAAAAIGGVHVDTFKDRSIEKAIDQIGGELHSQYNISYSPTDGAVSGYHQIKVTLDGKKLKDLKVRARPGYYLP
jgi:VWFA-related protein